MLFVDAINITTEDSPTGISENNTDASKSSVEISINNGNCVSVSNSLNREVNISIYRANGELLHSLALDAFDTQEFVLLDGMYIVKADKYTRKIRVTNVK